MTAGPRDVDWLGLVAACERRGIPVARSDRRGDLVVLRTMFDLAEFERRRQADQPNREEET